MKILLTGANGYIGTRLLPILLQKGYHVVCLVRDPRRFREVTEFGDHVEIIKGDLLDLESLDSIPKDIDFAYYLVHSMGSSGSEFYELEQKSAANFVAILTTTDAKQLIYLSGIVNDATALSKHLSSRLNVENVLRSGKTPLTVLRAAIIIGSGSASFEIIRDISEKLPIMVAPAWLNTRCQPIAIRDVLTYLEGVLEKPETLHQTFDIGGPDILTYKQMILKYAEARGLKRYIIILPFLSPKISSYWLYFVTSTSFSLAQSLVDSMKIEVICHDDRIRLLVKAENVSYEQPLNLAFVKIEQNSIVSSWKDALNRGLLSTSFMDQVKVPQNGTLEYKVKMVFDRETEHVLGNIWAIGGDRGWYYWDWIWNIRGFLDKVFGGVGSRRGRTSGVTIKAGDVLDFWRVLLADKKNNRLLLYAEMKLPGEAWLEFKILERDNEKILSQVATFRPNGLLGRIYWYAMMPFHYFIFRGMAKEIVNFGEMKK